MNPGLDPDPGTALSVGAQLDRYELVRRVATGGMGAIWLGRLRGKHGFEKPVAIKTILRAHGAVASFRDLFLEEARVAAKVAHPNVAQVLDVGEAGGVLYLVFEWVDGESIEQICRGAMARGEAPPLGRVLVALAEACAGLHAAHERGVVHRDVTPGNVLVDREGHAKLIDFGIAKARDRLGAETKSGLVRGTPEYMSPEQACGAPVDRRTDLWSVGAVLHRAATGEPPFRDAQDLVTFIQGSRALEMPAGLPADVAAILRRALTRSRDDRYSTAEAMAADLRGAGRAHGAVAASATIPGEPAAATSSSAPLPVTLAEGAKPVAAGVDPQGDTELAPGSSPPISRRRPGAVERDRTSVALRVALVVAVVAAASALAFALLSPPP